MKRNTQEKTQWAILLEETLDQKSDRPKGGKTIKELSKELNQTQHQIRAKVNKAIRLGKVKVVKGFEYSSVRKKRVYNVWYVML